MHRNHLTGRSLIKFYFIRGNYFFFLALLFYCAVAAPPIAVAETFDFSKADACRDRLLGDPDLQRKRQSWGNCITIYKETPSFKLGKGRAAYEIGRLYLVRYLSSDQFAADDLVQAERYFRLTIRKNRDDILLLAKAREQLNLMSPQLKMNTNISPIDPESSPSLTYELTPRLSVGAKINAEYRFRNNRDLRDANNDDDQKVEGGLSVAGLYLLSRKIELFGDVRAEGFERRRGDKEIKTSRDAEVELGKAYVLWNDFIFPSLGLQVGRQRFKDLREWVYDETLDAVKLFYEKKRFELVLSVSTNLIDPDDLEDEINNYIVYSVLPIFKKDKIAVYGVARDGTTKKGVDLDLQFYGIEFQGKSIKNHRYWAQIGSVFGNEGNTKIRGFGFDLGWTYRRKKALWRPNFTLGYGFGTGDKNPDDKVDRAFRQTGLQDNSAKFRGISRIKYYGELFEPELSNIHVFTAGFGLRPNKKASLDLVYHYYLQVWALLEQDNDLRDSGIRADPTGQSRDLGHEADLVFEWKVTERLRLGVTGAMFFPGAAFDEPDPAAFVEVKMRVEL